MLKLFTTWFRRQREEHQAVAAAISHFEGSAGRRAIRGMCGVMVKEPERIVVRICYGDTRPPRRVWFSVSSGHEVSVRELTWEEAQALGTRPWR